MIFRLGAVEIVSIVQAVLHVAVVLQEDTRQHIAQSSLAINHLQGCRGGGSTGVSHSRLARRLRSLHCDCTVQAKVDLKTFTKTGKLPLSPPHLSLRHNLTRLTLTYQTWLLLTLAVCGDCWREGEKMLDGGSRIRWSTSSSLSVFIKAGMEDPDEI